jgi:hypothetical protein
LANSVAAASEIGRGHRFGWRDCADLDHAPSVLLSAACSSGYSHIAGLGERLGLFRSFRMAGTTAMVAPRWDAVATSIIPILDTVLESHVAGRQALGKTLWQACRSAEAGGDARWLAWTLALEGDWR